MKDFLKSEIHFFKLQIYFLPKPNSRSKFGIKPVSQLLKTVLAESCKMILMNTNFLLNVKPRERNFGSGAASNFRDPEATLFLFGSGGKFSNFNLHNKKMK